MNITLALLAAEKVLKELALPMPTLDAEVLLSFILKRDRSWLYAHNNQKISPAQWKKFQKLIERRQHREPVAYLTGHQEFYGLDFLVNKNVLIPRPETELMIDYLKDHFSGGLIIDVGTGSGCLAVTAAKLWPTARVIAVDQSAAALKITRANARRHGVSRRVKFLKNDLLKAVVLPQVKTSVIILANLPYLSTDRYRRAPPEVRRFEPKQALWGGPDGLKYYRSLIKQLATRLRQPADTALLEIDPHQAPALRNLIKKQLPEAAIEIKKDLAGLDRLLIIKS